MEVTSSLRSTRISSSAWRRHAGDHERGRVRTRQRSGARHSGLRPAGNSTGEVMLDVCVIGSVAPGAHIFMYVTEFTTQGWVDALQEAITGDNDIAVISISCGNPEDDPQGAWTPAGVETVNQAFQAAIPAGVTICLRRRRRWIERRGGEWRARRFPGFKPVCAGRCGDEAHRFEPFSPSDRVGSRVE